MSLPHEEEIQRLKDAGEVLVRSLKRMTRERDEALENVRTLQTHIEVLREAHQSASREVERLLAERQVLADSDQSIVQNVCALLDLYHMRSLDAEKRELEALAEFDEAKATIRLVLEADCLKSHAFERGDDDASVYELCKSVVSKP